MHLAGVIAQDELHHSSSVLPRHTVPEDFGRRRKTRLLADRNDTRTPIPVRVEDESCVLIRTRSIHRMRSHPDR